MRESGVAVRRWGVIDLTEQPVPPIDQAPARSGQPATRAGRSRLRPVLRAVAIALAVVVAGVGSLVVYAYVMHPGRRTTDPVFTGLATTVDGSTLASPADPELELTFDERYHHVGGQGFVLYGTADTEQHFFVEEHPDGSMKGLFWVQFETFLPDNDFRYDYTDARLRLRIDDVDFYTDAEPGSMSPFGLEWPGTDGALAREFLADHGYSWPSDFAYARLVHLPTADRRSELLIIHIEDLAGTGLTGRGLKAGGDQEASWPAIEAAHLEQIERVMQLRRP